MSKSSLIFAGTTGVAAIMVAYLWHQNSIERDLNRQMASRVAQLERARHVAPGQQGAAVPARMRDAAPADVPAQAVVPTAPEASPPSQYVGQATSINMSDLLKDPKFREAQHTQMRLQMPQNYPDVARELGLSPAEMEAFFDLLARQQVNRMVLTATSNTSAGQAGTKGQRNLGDVMREDQADVAGLLGPTKNQSWQDYQKNLGARKQVGQLRATLSAAGYPLTDAQARPLLAAITAEQQSLADTSRYRQPSPDARAQAQHEESSVKAMEESNERVLDAARSYLDPRQLAALKSMMTQRSVMSRAMANARRAHLETGGGNPASSP